MPGSLDFPFGTVSVLTPVSAGTLLKADAAVDPNMGASPANAVAGDTPIGVAAYDSNSNPTQNPPGTLVPEFYQTPVKLFFNTELALVTGGGLVTRGNLLYGITGGFLAITGPAPALAVAADTIALTPGQEIQVYKIYVS